LTVSVSAGLMFPEADTLDETVPVWTVTVLATELDADAEWKIDSRPSVRITATPAVNTAYPPSRIRLDGARRSDM
jgi:hypothetical protein